MTNPNKQSGFFDAAAIESGIMRSDVDGLRALFGAAFWQNIPVRPGWPHLVMALRQNDRDVLRLLAHYAPAPTRADIDQLHVTSRGKYPQYIKMLRAAGVEVAPDMINRPIYMPSDPNTLLSRIPSEWVQLLKTIRRLSDGYGAVIAGGALRDVFNDRPVRDIDIFIPVQGDNPRMTEADIWKFFNCADLKYIRSYRSSGGVGYNVIQTSPASKGGQMGLRDGKAMKRHIVETWNVETEPSHTLYNLVFVGGVSGFGDLFAEKLIGSFDIGLCQIAFNGKKVMTTDAYHADVTQCDITLVNPNEGSDEHLIRIMKKYDGWQVCPAGRALLQQKSARHLFDQAFPGRKR